jgi:hypothetical protein
MTQHLDTLATIRRPALLIRAARFGMQDYNRNRHLKRVLNANNLPNPETSVPQLIATEAEFEATRKAGVQTYSVVRHLDALIALMSEAKLLH